MKQLLLISLMVLVSCTPTEVKNTDTDTTIKGEKVELKASAYEKMCERTPDSVLCKKDDS